MPGLHIAVLDEELPFPLNSGKRIRTHQLLSRLAKRHRITLISHRNSDPKEYGAARRHFDDLGIEVLTADRPPLPKAGMGFAARLACNLLDPLPYSVASHTSPAMVQLARVFARAHPHTLWHAEWTPLAQTIRLAGLSERPWLLMAHNVETQIWERQAFAESHTLKRFYIREQARKYATFERWACSTATRVVAVSEPDAEQIRTRFGGQEVTVVDNGVDPKYFAPRPEVERDPKKILFLGSLDWRANLDGVKLLLDSIFPRLRAAEPDAKLVIVGRNPPQWLSQLHGRPGLEVYGNVVDVRPYLAECGVLAVPLRVGGGSRLKILEALAMGTPVVSTVVGAEGLDLKSERHLRIVTDENAMTSGLQAALRRPGEMRAWAESGRAVVLSRYDWDILAERLDACWHEMLEFREHTRIAA